MPNNLLVYKEKTTEIMFLRRMLRISQGVHISNKVVLKKIETAMKRILTIRKSLLTYPRYIRVNGGDFEWYLEGG